MQDYRPGRGRRVGPGVQGERWPPHPSQQEGSKEWAQKVLVSWWSWCWEDEEVLQVSIQGWHPSESSKLD